ncbi:MAG: DNA translocase FtsK, partial [Clostridia bacterium]|nr:DNA translocase FtsK [Clostridia bacterium]
PITAEEYPEPSEAVLSPLYDTEDKPTVAESISEDEPATDEEETDINEDSDPFEEERTVAKGIMKFGRLSGKRPTRTFASISDTANAEPEPPKPTAVESGEPPKPTEEATDNVKKWTKGDKYAYPPTTLLNPIPEKNRITEEEVKAVAQKILNKLSSLKVKASLVGYSIGPTITRYELAPGEGVRVNKISQLIDDISLELASDGVRIEAPIPGKAAVGIEVPNKNVSLVSFRELAEDPRFVKAASKITVCVGQNLTGGAEFMDIDDMPHVLIAGQTKSGKSVAINCMILSFLFRVSPDEVKLILIDPKRVEFNIYSKLPHLVMPVIDEPTKAAAALSWAVKEMERRYDVMKEYDARYREEYLMKTASIPDRDEFPQIVIIIDELADLMLQVRDQVDPLINRLAAKARACGIHLLVGTQRPSADVLTGLIKANIPGRISFKVAEQVDARIIGAAGAEKLLGKGDMLYRPTGKATVRVQGAYVDGIEINKVIDYVLEKNGQADFDPDVIAQLEEEEKSMLKIKKRSGAADDDGDGDREKKVDPLLMNAIEIAVENQSISTSSLQRFLEVGYGRGAKLIDSMERLGIVGPPNGSKPREVYMDMEQFSVWKLEQRFD